MGKPRIGLTPLWDEQRNSIWMLPGYMEGILRAGGLPLILPLDDDGETLEEAAEFCDGILFTGGQDISPGLYGAEQSPLCGPVCGVRDRMEAFLFSKVEQGKPALGICRGIQLFNVLLGGTLYQDLAAQFNRAAAVHGQKPPYDEPAHRVRIAGGSPLHKLLGKESLAVNSSHHQGIAELAPRLRPMAWAEDGLVEAAAIADKPFAWALQWHPEMALAWESSGKIFAAFTAACALAARTQS